MSNTRVIFYGNNIQPEELHALLGKYLLSVWQNHTSVRFYLSPSFAGSLGKLQELCVVVSVWFSYLLNNSSMFGRLTYLSYTNLPDIF